MMIEYNVMYMSEEPTNQIDPSLLTKYISKMSFIPATMPGNQYTKPIEDHNIFVPSMSGMESRAFLKIDDGDREYDVSWWRVDGNRIKSFYYYPHMLISYWYGKDVPGSFREKFGLPPKDKFDLCGDSGGFQIVTGKTKSIDPIKALRWQEENCNWGFVMDYPPLMQDATNSWTLGNDKDIADCQRKTAANAALQHKEWNDDTYEMVFVAHGVSWDQMARGVKMLGDHGVSLDDFSGVSISCKYSDPLTVARGCAFAIEYVPQNKRFHYLALSGYKTTMVYVYAMTYRPDIISTMDSSSYGSQGNIRRVYWMDDMREVLEFGSSNTTNLKVLPCNCPVCMVVKNPELLRGPGSLPGGVISLHNLYVYVTFVEKLKAYATNRDELKAYILRLCPDLQDSLSYIDVFMERGHEVAEDKYFRTFRKLKRPVNGMTSKL